MDDVPSRMLLQLAAVLCFAVLSGTEAALEAVDKAEIEEESKTSRAAWLRVAVRFIRLEPQTMHAFHLAEIFWLGLSGIVFGMRSCPAWAASLRETGLGSAFADVIAAVMALVIMFLGFFLFGRMIVYRWASRHEKRFLRLWAVPAHLLKVILEPLSLLFTAVADGILKIFGMDNPDQDDVTEEEIRAMVDLGSESGTIDPKEREVIRNVLELENITAEDVMVHRTDLQVLFMEDTVGEWEKAIEEANHSRLPVCGETVDDIEGILFIKDFYIARGKGASRTEDFRPLLREPYYVPESVSADQLLHDMQKSRNQFAVVIDEYGGLSGILTMHDLLEKLVGDISDNWSDEEEEGPDIVKLSENSFRIRGTTPLEDVQEELGVELPTDEYDTFGGMILDQLPAVPEDGEKIPPLSLYGLDVEVEEIQAHRAEWTRVTLQPPAAEKDQGEEDRQSGP